MSSRTRWFLLLLVLAAALAIGTAGWGALYNETDGQYSGAAKVMAQGGSWLIPDNNGIPRLVKPPFLYWTMAASMKVFGLNEFAARLPSALALVCWVALTFLIVAHLSAPFRAFLAGAILLTSLGTFTLGRIVMPEPWFAAFIAASLYCTLCGHDDETTRKRWYLGFWLAAALATFTKGPHGLLYPLAIVGLTALFCPASRPRLRGLLSWPGVLLFLLINLPWHLYVENHFPGWFHHLFFAEHLGHMTGGGVPVRDYTDVPRWQFVALHFAWFFPWAALALGAWLTNLKTFSPRRTFAATLIATWAAVVFISVLCTGERQDYYAMSMWPAFAIAAAFLLDRPRLKLVTAAYTAFLLAAGLIAFALLRHISAPADHTGTVAERSTAWLTVSNFGPEVWVNLAPGLWTLFAMAATAALAFVLLLKNHRQPALVALIASAALLDLGATFGTATVAPYFSLAPASRDLNASLTPDTTLIYDGGLDSGSSLLFYTSHPVTLLDQHPENDFLVTKFHIHPERFLTTDALPALWQSSHPVLLVTESCKLPAWSTLLGRPPQVVARSGTQVVLKN